MATLKETLLAQKTTIIPGAADTQSVALIEESGQFPAAYLDGYDLAQSMLASQNEGLVAPSETARALRNTQEKTRFPIIADAQSGFGNQLTAYFVVQDLERSGAVGVVLNDQIFPAHTSSQAETTVTPIAFNEFVAKLKAARGALENPDAVVLAKLDGLSVYGIDGLRKRAHYLTEHALADLVLVDGVTTAALSDLASLAADLPLGLILNLETTADLAAVDTSAFAAIFYTGALTAARVQAEKTQLKALAK